MKRTRKKLNSLDHDFVSLRGVLCRSNLPLKGGDCFTEFILSEANVFAMTSKIVNL